MSMISTFLRDDKGAVTVEAAVLLPFFVFLMVFFADASVVYLTHTEMYNSARDIARRMATGELETASEVRDYAEDQLHLGARQYIVDPRFGNSMSVTVAIGFDDAVIFGAFFEPLLGDTLAARAVAQREPQLTPN